MRDHLYAIYAFARTADDIADEGTLDAVSRIAKLEVLRVALRSPSPDDPIQVALLNTITTCRLPLSLFDRLLDAFVADSSFIAPTSWDDVLKYCSNSANPVGELFLRLDHSCNEPSEAAIHASNCICTALQITNFLQDVSIDLSRHRNYLPLPDHEVIVRTRELYREGSTVVRYATSWRVRLELWAIVHGGRTMLELCANRQDRMIRPTLTAWKLVVQLFRPR
jgi:phytoene/squalene synthetase